MRASNRIDGTHLLKLRSVSIDTPARDTIAGRDRMTEQPLSSSIVAQPSRAERLALRVLQLGAIAVVLAASPRTLFDLDRFLVPKELVLHLTAVVAGLLAVRAVRRTVGGWVDWALVVYLLLGLTSAAMATNGWLAMRAVAVTASGIVIFWTARALRAAGLHRAVLGGVAVAVVVAAVTSLLQAYGVRIGLFALNRAPGGTLGNRNFVAHVAAFGLPVLFYVALRGRRFLFGAAGVSIVSASLVLTRSRAAWLAAAAALVVFIIAGREWKRLSALLLFAGAGVVAALLIPNALRWRSDNPYFESVTGVVNYERGSGRGRLVQYGQSLRLAAAHPLFGVGPGNWAVEYPRVAARNDPSLDTSEGGMTFNPWPSSDWVATVVERGFAAALLLAMVIAGIAWNALALRGADDRLAVAALLATVAAAVIAGAFDSVLLLAGPTLLVWAAVGALWPSQPAGMPWIVVVAMIALSASGAVRSTAQLVAMEIYATHGDRASLERASQIDPGSYRLQVRLARGGKRETRCEHARAALSLFPNAATARELARGCR